MNATETIQAAYYAGFEPSGDDLPLAALLTEALDYLISII